MVGAKHSGGMTHLKYGHSWRSRTVEVDCPSCGGSARATKPSEAHIERAVVSDLSPSWSLDDWEVQCPHCLKRLSGLSYDELPGLTFSGGDSGVWAWNADHARCMVEHLSGRDTSHDPHHALMTYLRGRWKRRPASVIADLKRMLCA